MRFKLYRNFGALNSVPIFNAVEQGLKRLGHEIVDENEDVPVIWSVLWHGRMESNRQVYQHFTKKQKSVLIIEVGCLKRGVTWKISLNNINGLGFFGQTGDTDLKRSEKLGLEILPFKENRKKQILVACQHAKSLQWEGLPSIEQWVKDTISQIRRFSDREILVRPHPRWPLRENILGVGLSLPKKLINTYDDFDIDYNFHCVINHNSGPAVQAAISGVPVICDSSSLAYPISEKWENLENAKLPDREKWFLELCHTEWTVEEIAQGIPLERIIKNLP